MWENLSVSLDYLVRRKTFSGWEICPRCIQNYEIVLVLNGVGYIRIRDKSFSVEKGDCVCFSPNVKHSLWVKDEPYMEFYGAHFSLLSEAEGFALPDLIHLNSIKFFERLFKDMEIVRHQTDELSRWRQNLYMQQIICNIYTVLKKEQSPANSARIQKALSFIHEDPMRDMDIAELLKYSGVQKTLFIEQFRKITGTTPRQYITKLRLDTARDLLMQTDLPIAVIAEHCGFSDPFYFTRLFKKNYLLPPSKYRNMEM